MRDSENDFCHGGKRSPGNETLKKRNEQTAFYSPVNSGVEILLHLLKSFTICKSGNVFSIFSKDRVTGSGSSEGRGARLVLGREKELNGNFEKEPIAKEISGKGI